MATPHIESKIEEISKYVIMPGDPKRAKFIADNYLEDSKLVNSVRGMTAYTGYYKGRMVTVFPSGMGIPSMGIYSYELMNEYGAEVLIRIGTMGSYSADLNPYDIVIAEESYSESSYGEELNGKREKIVSCSKELLETAKLNIDKLDFPVKTGRVYSAEAFYGKADYNQMRDEKGLLGVEMESYALYTNAKELNKKALTILTVSDSFVTNEKLTSAERERNVEAMVVLALETIMML